MKRYLTIVYFVIAAANISNAQDTVKRNIPLLKESARIDSLISSVIKSHENITAPKNDSCFLLGLSKNEDANFIQGIHALNHKEIIFSLAHFENKKTLGYFEFDGYLVFVYCDAFMGKFLKYTKSKKEFTFIKATVKEEVFVMTHFMSRAVLYEHGKFYYGEY